MPATSEQSAFVRQEFRSVTVGPQTTIDTLYGALARRTSDPIETFFEAEADAQEILNERIALIGADRRRMVQTVSGEETGLAIAYVGTTASAQIIDDNRLLDQPALISEVTIDFGKAQTTLESWG